MEASYGSSGGWQYTELLVELVVISMILHVFCVAEHHIRDYVRYWPDGIELSLMNGTDGWRELRGMVMLSLKTSPVTKTTIIFLSEF
jgi:hypothetical protein